MQGARWPTGLQCVASGCSDGGAEARVRPAAGDAAAGKQPPVVLLVPGNQSRGLGQSWDRHCTDTAGTLCSKHSGIPPEVHSQLAVLGADLHRGGKQVGQGRQRVLPVAQRAFRRVLPLAPAPDRQRASRRTQRRSVRCCRGDARHHSTLVQAGAGGVRSVAYLRMSVCRSSNSGMSTPSSAPAASSSLSWKTPREGARGQGCGQCT